MAIERRGTILTRQPTSHPAESADLTQLYERDYYTWTGMQARALRARKVSGLDWDNLAEEVEDLGKAEVHRLESHLELLLMHLLKWVYQPQRRSRSWSNSVREHRFRIQRVLRANPGLKAKLPEIFADAYEAARLSAENETGLDLSTVPESRPWTLDDAMRDDFWPGGSPTVKRSRRINRSNSNR
jgi:hypothetical protein